MRLNQYLMEGNEMDQLYLGPDEIVKQIKHFCKDYLKLLKGRMPLWKGIEIASKVGNKPVRKNRRPMGTSDKSFKFINKWLDSKHWPRRDKSVICTSNKSWTSSFGNPRMIFPVEMKGYAWIESSDFNNSSFKDSDFGVPDNWDIYKLEDAITANKPLAEDILEAFVHGNKHFDVAYNREYEIWFECKRYYYLSITTMDGELQNDYINAFKKAGIKVK